MTTVAPTKAPEGSRDQTDGTEDAFSRLVAEWKAARTPTSSARRMVDHPGYQAIIRLGMPAVPLILAELEREPDHWFIALSEITGASPVPAESRGNLAAMTAAWLKWWEEGDR